MTQELSVGSRRGTFSIIAYYTFCDNNGAVANSKEPRTHKRTKYIERKYHLIQDIVHRGEVVVTKIVSSDNLVDPFTKSSPAKIFYSDLEGIRLRCITTWL